MHAITIRLPEEIQERLLELSEKTGRSKSFYVREALVEYLEDMEDIYLADKTMADLKAKKIYTIPLEDVMKEYDLI